MGTTRRINHKERGRAVHTMHVYCCFSQFRFIMTTRFIMAKQSNSKQPSVQYSEIGIDLNASRWQLDPPQESMLVWWSECAWVCILYEYSPAMLLQLNIFRYWQCRYAKSPADHTIYGYLCQYLYSEMLMPCPSWQCKFLLTFKGFSVLPAPNSSTRLPSVSDGQNYLVLFFWRPGMKSFSPDQTLEKIVKSWNDFWRQVLKGLAWLSPAAHKGFWSNWAPNNYYFAELETPGCEAGILCYAVWCCGTPVQGGDDHQR